MLLFAYYHIQKNPTTCGIFELLRNKRERDTGTLNCNKRAF